MPGNVDTTIHSMRNSRPSAMPQRPRAVAGFTLIEVMVALIVLVLGVLGAAGMTLTALRDGKQSSTRSQGVAMAYELADLMRANKAASDVFLSSAAPTAFPCYGTSTSCTPAEMASNEFYEWKRKLAAASGVGLPNALVIVCRDATNLNVMGSAASCDNASSAPLVVKMSWDEKLNDGTFVASSAPRLVLPVQP